MTGARDGEKHLRFAYHHTARARPRSSSQSVHFSRGKCVRGGSWGGGGGGRRRRASAFKEAVKSMGSLRPLDDFLHRVPIARPRETLREWLKRAVIGLGSRPHIGGVDALDLESEHSGVLFGLSLLNVAGVVAVFCAFMTTLTIGQTSQVYLSPRSSRWRAMFNVILSLSPSLEHSLPHIWAFGTRNPAIAQQSPRRCLCSI